MSCDIRLEVLEEGEIVGADNIEKMARRVLRIDERDIGVAVADCFAREILEDALAQYNGAIICLSHDRFFIEKCADKVLGFSDGTAKLYDTYEYY